MRGTLIGAESLFAAHRQKKLQETNARAPCLIKMLAARINFHTQTHTQTQGKSMKTCAQHVEHFSALNSVEFITYSSQ